MNAEKKPYIVRFWHGTPAFDSHFLKRVKLICRYNDLQNNYFWDGTMDEFIARWQDKFIFIPPQTTTDAEYVLGSIYITWQSNFGQR